MSSVTKLNYVKLPEAASKIESETGKPFDVDKLLHAGFYGDIAIGVCLGNQYCYLDCGELEKFIGRKIHEEAEVFLMFDDPATAKRSNCEMTAEIVLADFADLSELEIAEILETGSRPFYWKGAAKDLVVSYNELDELKKLYASEREALSKPTDWTQVRISLRAVDRIAWTIEGHSRGGNCSLFDVGLMDRKQNKLNKGGRILADLAQGKKFPKGTTTTDADKSSMVRLNKIIKGLLSATNNPFHRFNKADGYKPRFTLSDSRNAADERAKKQAEYRTGPFDDSKNYGQSESGFGNDPGSEADGVPCDAGYDEEEPEYSFYDEKKSKLDRDANEILRRVQSKHKPGE